MTICELEISHVTLDQKVKTIENDMANLRIVVDQLRGAFNNKVPRLNARVRRLYDEMTKQHTKTMMKIN